MLKRKTQDDQNTNGVKSIYFYTFSSDNLSCCDGHNAVWI